MAKKTDKTANTVNLIASAAEKYYLSLKEPNSRLLSWEHCYTAFYNARSKGKKTDADYDLLSLHLAFYLASWGMYRGSSFLLQRDYKVHEPVVREILNQKYDNLVGVDCSVLATKQDVQAGIEFLNNYIVNYYSSADIQPNPSGKAARVSDTLITKILMGTLGCVPAYDRFFCDAVKSLKITTGVYNMRSLCGLANFYQANQPLFERSRSKFVIHEQSCLQYPQMKYLDMGLWQIGME